MQPMLVRPVDRERYEIIAGERRWRAAQMAGLESPGPGARSARRGGARHVAHREHPARGPESAGGSAGLQRLIDEFKTRTHQQAADAVGARARRVPTCCACWSSRGRSRRCSWKAALDMGHARALLGSTQGAQMRWRAGRQEGLSVRETESAVAGCSADQRCPRKRDGPRSRRLEEESPTGSETVRDSRGKQGRQIVLVTQPRSPRRAEQETPVERMIQPLRFRRVLAAKENPQFYAGEQRPAEASLSAPCSAWAGGNPLRCNSRESGCRYPRERQRPPGLVSILAGLAPFGWLPARGKGKSAGEAADRAARRSGEVGLDHRLIVAGSGELYKDIVVILIGSSLVTVRWCLSAWLFSFRTLTTDPGGQGIRLPNRVHRHHLTYPRSTLGEGLLDVPRRYAGHRAARRHRRHRLHLVGGARRDRRRAEKRQAFVELASTSSTTRSRDLPRLRNLRRARSR